MIFPDSFRIFNRSQLRALAPRLTHLKLQQDPLPRGSVFAHRVHAIERLIYPHLTVLRLSGPRMDVSSLLAASPKLRASFPSLGALFLTRIHIRAQTLKTILVHLGPQLETLVFQSVIIRSANDYHGLGTAFGPMSLLNYDIIPDNFLPSLKELRIPGIHYYFSKPPLSIRNLRSGLPKLARLSLDVTLLDVVHVLPASLEQLTVYHRSKMAPSSRASDMGDITDPWQTVQHLKMRLARFKSSAPRLRAILLRVSSAPIRALPDWRMLSFLLAGVLGNLDIQFQSEVHVNEPSVRLALHREHCIEAGLPITDADERLLHADVTSSYFQRDRKRI
ncbi:hypothetical protein EXIGLDRAFT_844066 [Exidia glandulosa HHB12029]|uniref:F-box domain-containing protein n=1 Tax=Exidia glandulosa HHB12029 TaxID=1314781 RepID=A0A165C9F8_EXIGL|nr:hypothetical protein EXIGLDRAFT_844066 [Exidia glandulosa HHB12029]